MKGRIAISVTLSFKLTASGGREQEENKTKQRKLHDGVTEIDIGPTKTAGEGQENRECHAPETHVCGVCLKLRLNQNKKECLTPWVPPTLKWPGIE